MSRPLVFESVLDLIGSTPLVRIHAEEEISGKKRANVWAKLENANPGGSVKDRIALSMIEGAEKSGDLRSGGVVIEATSGNTGIGLAVVCAVKGYRCILTMPET
ncbi:MAG: pyridoxal-phosphate dependent enzyme, partial [Polyangiaceae bacterium]